MKKGYLIIQILNHNSTEYNLSVEASVDSIDITAILLNESSSEMTINGESTSSGVSKTISLNKDDPTIITIVVDVDNGDSKSYTITVNKDLVRVSDVSIINGDLEIAAGDSLQLDVAITPINASNQNVSWSSDDEDIEQ